MPASHDNPVSIEKAFTLKFLKPNPSVEIDSDKWSWQPAIRHDALGMALLHKSEGRRDYPSPRRSYAMAPTGTVLGRPSCVKRLSRATRTCNSTTCRSNVRAITRWPRRLKQCILVSTRLLR